MTKQEKIKEDAKAFNPIKGDFKDLRNNENRKSDFKVSKRPQES